MLELISAKIKSLNTKYVHDIHFLASLKIENNFANKTEPVIIVFEV
jgi:hypothetical protein